MTRRHVQTEPLPIPPDGLYYTRTEGLASNERTGPADRRERGELREALDVIRQGRYEVSAWVYETIIAAVRFDLDGAPHICLTKGD